MDRESAEPSVDSLPGPRASDRVAYHRRFAAPSTYVFDFVWDVSADATGPFCTDADGNVLLDFTSHVGAAPLGYNNPLVLDRLRAFDLVDPLKIAGQDFYATAGDPMDPDIPGPADLMERLVEITEQFGMDTVFLSNSGAEAVENAVKISYDHTRGRYAVTFEGAFHGRTLGTLSLNRSKAVHRRGFPEIPSVHDVPFCQQRSCTAETCSCGFFIDDTSVLRRMLHPEKGYVESDEVAFLIFEPVQGEGGYRIPSESFMSEVAAICAEHNVLLVADEVQSGLGRTGELWAVQHYDIEPDVIAAGKGLRVGATIGGSEVFPDERGRLSSTWGAGDLLASAHGAFTIDAIRDADLLENATRRGSQFVETVADADPPGIDDVRNLGLMIAVDLESRTRRNDVQTAAFERGLLTLGCGHRTLRILPPLDVRDREIEMGADLLLEALTATA